MRPGRSSRRRVAAPLQTLFRRVRSDVELPGVTILAGALVEVRFGAANRDSRKFPCPADVDLERRNSAGRLSFGAGIHMCIGNQLARAELRLAFPDPGPAPRGHEVGPRSGQRPASAHVHHLRARSALDVVRCAPPASGFDRG